MGQVARWGNSQGIRLPKKILKSVGLELNEQVEITLKGNSIIIKPTVKKTLEWYLESYHNEPDDRYDWGESDAPKGRELL
ncbi:MAG: AbrB/MazE/SpoVT family DNA-binding domain-containing protein [Oscillospiraceae bacterium]|nr:AbrB/MazE/SpoVT family DNA-binding domain-containing protein [Oscillospiraceae bacterium]